MGDPSKGTDAAAEAARKARQKVDLQRGMLAKMAVSDPRRPAEEAMLSSMIQSASMADLHLAMLLDEEEQAAERAASSSQST